MTIIIIIVIIIVIKACNWCLPPWLQETSATTTGTPAPRITPHPTRSPSATGPMGTGQQAICAAHDTHVPYMPHIDIRYICHAKTYMPCLTSATQSTHRYTYHATHTATTNIPYVYICNAMNMPYMPRCRSVCVQYLSRPNLRAGRPLIEHELLLYYPSAKKLYSSCI